MTIKQRIKTLSSAIALAVLAAAILPDPSVAAGRGSTGAGGQGGAGAGSAAGGGPGGGRGQGNGGGDQGFLQVPGDSQVGRDRWPRHVVVPASVAVPRAGCGRPYWIYGGVPIRRICRVWY